MFLSCDKNLQTRRARMEFQFFVSVSNRSRAAMNNNLVVRELKKKNTVFTKTDGDGDFTYGPGGPIKVCELSNYFLFSTFRMENAL